MSETYNKIKFIFENINGWLKFAESKNAGLLVFNSGVSLAIVRLIDSEVYESRILTWYLIFCIFLFVASATICLLSFVPKIAIPSIFVSKIADVKEINLLFFGDIGRCSPEQYMEALVSQKMIKRCESQDIFLKSLTNQIVVNSSITNTKFSYHRVAIWLTVAGVVTPFIATILGLVLYGRRYIQIFIGSK